MQTNKNYVASIPGQFIRNFISVGGTMDYKITIIICYFGELPEIFPLWIKSCEKNPEFDFLIFTDQEVCVNTSNIIVKKTNLKFIRQLAEKKLKQDNICISHAYKLCDYKPMYGVIFEDYLENSNFWGMCDMDMIFGDLSQFITPEILENFDKVYQHGHLTLYRNTYEVNHSFELPGFVDWKDVVHTNKHCRLCERGMMEKHRHSSLRVFCNRDYADVSKIHRRYQLSKWLVPEFDKDRYKYQLFYCDNGHIYRAVLQSGVVFRQEFTYVHLQKRKLKKPDFVYEECYYITKNQFIMKKEGIPKAEIIKKLNPYRGLLFELYECIEFEVRKQWKRIKYEWERRK